MAKGLNSSAPTTGEIVAGTYNASQPTLADGQGASFQLDVNGNLKVATTGSAGTQDVNLKQVAGSPIGLGNPVPVEFSDGTNPFGTPGNPISVNVITGGGSNASVGLTGATAPTSATEIGVIDGTGKLQGASSSNPVRVDPTGTTTQPVSAASLPLPTGASTSANQTNGTQKSQTVDGSGNVQPAGDVPARSIQTEITDGTNVLGTSAHPVSVAGTIANNAGAPGTNNIGAMPMVSTAATPTYADGNEVFLSGDLQGNLRVVPGGNITTIQKTNNISSGSVASLAKAFTSNVKLGSTLIVACGVGNLTTPTVTDTAGNTYIPLVSKASAAFNVAIFAATSAVAGANTVTVNNGGAAASIAMEIYELAGLYSVANAILDKSNTGAATSAAPSSGVVTPSLANEIMIGVIGVGTAAQTVTVTAGTTPNPVWSNDSGNLNPTTPAGLFSLVVGSAQAWNGAATAFAGTMTSEPWAAAVVSLRPFFIPVVAQVQGTTAVAAGAPNPVNVGIISAITGNLINTPVVNGASSDAIAVTLGSQSGAVEGVSVRSMAGGGGGNTSVLITQGVCTGVPAASSNTGGLVALRTPNVFKTVSVAATATGNTAVWTPTSGKKFRLMKFQITAQGLAATATGVVTVSFQDSASGITFGTYDIDVPATASLVSGITQVSGGLVDMGNGFVSAAANNVLNFNISAAGAGTVGTYRVNVMGNEE